MSNVLLIDTSVYRELGLKFYDRIDYRNLCSFCAATGIEVLISRIVIEEFSNYYKNQLVKEQIEYKNSISDLIRDPFFSADL